MRMSVTVGDLAGTNNLPGYSATLAGEAQEKSVLPQEVAGALRTPGLACLVATFKSNYEENWRRLPEEVFNVVHAVIVVVSARDADAAKNVRAFGHFATLEVDARLDPNIEQ